jgi:hypothetical protein
MNEIWLRPLVWTDYRLAIFFLVSMPLVLLLWATINRKEAIQRLLIIYWRVSSLLMITVYLMIPGWRIGFITAIAALILIPISLWFWIDLNEEIRDMSKSSLKLVFTSWRWATSIYCILGVFASIPFLNCGFSKNTLAESLCQIWLEAPQLYRQMFHNKPGNEGFLGFMGMVGLTVYTVYFLYFVVMRVGKQGRSALEQ